MRQNLFFEATVAPVKTSSDGAVIVVLAVFAEKTKQNFPLFSEPV